MERYASKESGADTSNWGTNLGFIKNGLDSASSTISGTPGRRNSVSYLVNKGQDITKDFTLTAEEGSYVIPKLTTITADATLTIEPGVTTSFYNNPTTHETGILIVQGRLDVQGTSTAPVVFDSFTPGQQQGSLFFVGGFSSATSTIEHALFKNTANMQVYNNAKVKISDSDFVGNQLGVRVGLNGTAEIENSRFSHTFNSAIDAFSGATLIVASTTIDSSYAGGGINTYDSKVSIATTTVQAVDPEDGATGISVHGGTATISGATVSGFTSGSGISVGLGRIGIDNQIVVPGVVANISGTEVTGNNIGVKMETGSAIIAPDVSIHDNVANLSVCAPGGLCVES